MSTRYSTEPTNPSPLEVVNSATFGPAVRRAFHDMGRVDVTPYAIPWSGIDVPLVSDLPVRPNDRAEVNLLVGDGLTRMVYRQATARWYQIGATPIVTSLPSDAPDGLSVAYIAADPVNSAYDVAWQFRYHADGNETYSWEFVGGSPLHAEVGTEQTYTAVTYGNMATVGPGVTLALAGIYMVSFGASQYQITSGIGYVGHTIGPTGGIDANGIAYGGTTTSVNLARTRRETFAAGDTCVLVYRTTSGTLVAGNRWLSVTPIKVSA